MTTAERALHVLIHDIRTPVGVAQGYLRLLGENRLATPEEKLRAIARAQRALDQISQLCGDAAILVQEPPSARVVVPCDRFVGRVRERLGREVVAWAARPAAGRAVEVSGDTEQLAEAVTRVLLAGPDPSERPRPVAIGTTETELWFTSGLDAALAGEALDPWRGPGLALPLACRAIAHAGGRVWAAGSARAGTGVALPLEVAR